MSSVVETVSDLVTPILGKYHFELVDVEFVKEGQNWYLRVFIDKEGGITIDECALVSDELGEKLDACDPDSIQQAYYLEVSSPGAERPLKKDKDFEKAAEKQANIFVTLYEKVAGNKQYEGHLVNLKADELTIEYRDKTRTKEVVIPRKKVAKARLAIEF